MPPFFSIVIPVYNRATLVGRALRSCFAQDLADFEVIAVDDSSSDDSLAVLRSFDDPRLIVVAHERNRGVGPARNSGVDRASGEWIVCLDSDDELLPGALRAMHARANDAVDGMRFMVRIDDGAISPDPPLRGEVWDYESYLRWMNESFARRQETLPVVRRRTFDVVRYSEGRALESLYHLDFAAHFRIGAYPDVVRLYHHDAENQLTKPSIEQSIGAARDQARQTEELLARHGEALARLAPRVYQQLASGLSTMYFLAGERRAGMRATWRSLRRRPASLRQWAVLMLGLAGPRPLAYVQTMRARA